MKVRAGTNNKIQINQAEDDSIVHFGYDDSISNKYIESYSPNRELDYDKEVVIEYIENPEENFSADVTDSDDEAHKDNTWDNPSRNIPYNFSNKIQLPTHNDNVMSDFADKIKAENMYKQIMNKSTPTEPDEENNLSFVMKNEEEDNKNELEYGSFSRYFIFNNKS